MKKLIISTDQSLMDREFIVRETQASYWAAHRIKAQIIKSLENSLCFGVFLDGQQIGLARVVSDFATIAYLCDVIIAKEYQGQGYGQSLMSAVINHDSLKDIKWILRTKDAHGLYEKFGFCKTERPERYMEK